MTSTRTAEWTTSPDPQDPELKRLHLGGVKVGYYASTGRLWMATYSATGTITPHDSPEDAIAWILDQHQVAQYVASAVRAIRPATGAGVASVQATWDAGYNTALRDIERVLAKIVGAAPQGEGYTAITGEVAENA